MTSRPVRRIVDRARPAGLLPLLVLLMPCVLGPASSRASDDEVRIVFLQPEASWQQSNLYQSEAPLFDQVDLEIDLESGHEIGSGSEAMVPVERVELRFDGGLVGALESPPWRWSVNVGPHNRDRTFYVDVHLRGGEVKRVELFAPRFEADDEIDLGLRQIYASVTDRRGNRVLDLEADDFSLEDDGRRQKIVTFERGDIPFTAVLLVDGSGSMRGAAMATALRGARRFVRSLKEHDEVKVMLFDERLRATTRWLGEHQETELAQQLEEAVSDLDGFGGSAVFDHLFLALQRGETRHGRRAVILLSDGWDVHSVLTFQQMIEAARRSQSQVYVIRRSNVEVKSYEREGWAQPGALTSLHTSSQTRVHYRILGRLAESTGGRVLDIGSVDEVDAALQEVLAELREQYALGFYPSNSLGDGSWHEVELSVAVQGLDVRTREGYVDD